MGPTNPGRFGLSHPQASFFVGGGVWLLLLRKDMMMDDFIEEYNEKKKRYLLLHYWLYTLCIVSIIIARANVEATVFCYLNTTRFH